MLLDIPLPMIGRFTRNWWVFLLRGIIAMLFGILVLRLPALHLSALRLPALVLLFGIYALVDGICSALNAGWSDLENRWLILLEGLIGICAGFFTLRAPRVTAVALMFFIAIWALAIGVLRIVAAIRLRKKISGEVWMALSGIASVIFAFLVLFRPAVGALALVWAIAWYALLMGGMLVMLSLELHGLRRQGYQARLTEPPTRWAA